MDPLENSLRALVLSTVQPVQALCNLTGHDVTVVLGYGDDPDDTVTLPASDSVLQLSMSAELSLARTLPCKQDETRRGNVLVYDVPTTWTLHEPVPVVPRGGTCAGIVTTMDVARWLSTTTDLPALKPGQQRVPVYAAVRRQPGDACHVLVQWPCDF